jgi:hypothetical protein
MAPFLMNITLQQIILKSNKYVLASTVNTGEVQ